MYWLITNVNNRKSYILKPLREFYTAPIFKIWKNWESKMRGLFVLRICFSLISCKSDHWIDRFLQQQLLAFCSEIFSRQAKWRWIISDFPIKCRDNPFIIPAATQKYTKSTVENWFSKRLRQKKLILNTMKRCWSFRR